MLSEFYILKSRINFPVTLGFVESIIVQLASWAGGGGRGEGWGERLFEWSMNILLVSDFLVCFFVFLF